MRVDGVGNNDQQDNKPKVQAQGQFAQNIDIHTQYREFVEKQKAYYNSFRQQKLQEFNDLVKAQDEKFDKALGFERQATEATPAPKMVETGPNTPEYDKAIHSYEKNQLQVPHMPVKPVATDSMDNLNQDWVVEKYFRPIVEKVKEADSNGLKKGELSDVITMYSLASTYESIIDDKVNNGVTIVARGENFVKFEDGTEIELYADNFMSPARYEATKAIKDTLIQQYVDGGGIKKVNTKKHEVTFSNGTKIKLDNNVDVNLIENACILQMKKDHDIKVVDDNDKYMTFEDGTVLPKTDTKFPDDIVTGLNLRYSKTDKNGQVHTVYAYAEPRNDGKNNIAVMNISDSNEASTEPVIKGYIYEGVEPIETILSPFGAVYGVGDTDVINNNETYYGKSENVDITQYNDDNLNNLSISYSSFNGKLKSMNGNSKQSEYSEVKYKKE